MYMLGCTAGSACVVDLVFLSCGMFGIAASNRLANKLVDDAVMRHSQRKARTSKSAILGFDPTKTTVLIAAAVLNVHLGP